VTGQSAQGKTLPSVVTSLHEGGFAAYVAASRARTRQGLCILEPVRLSDLNKPLLYDLLVEIRCLEALEHNMYIHYDYKTGSLVPVPDPESEIGMTYPLPKVSTAQIFTTCNDNDNENHSSSINESTTLVLKNDPMSVLSLKRKVEPDASVGDDRKSKSRKLNRFKVGSHASGFKVNGGCQWSSTNWSCAYDSVITCLATIYLN
jgi:hypothetical protein